MQTFARGFVAIAGLALFVGCGDAYEEAPPPELPPPPPQTAPVDAQPMPPSMSTNTSSGPNAVTANENQNVTIEPSTPPAAPSQAPAATSGATVVTTEAAPAEAQWVYQYPTGQWVYTSDYGWVWIPAAAEQVDEEGVPYDYLYTPRWGWTWYVSPWGPGPYHYGIWVRHPWHPYGWRGGFVAHPQVIVHIGGHYGYHGGYHGYHGGGGYHGHGGGHHR